MDVIGGLSSFVDYFCLGFSVSRHVRDRLAPVSDHKLQARLAIALMSTPEQDHDHDHLLKILQAQGHRFMSSFSLYEPSPKKRKRTDGEGKGKKKVSKSSNSDGGEEKWVGINLSDNPRDIFDNESEGSKSQFLLLILRYVSSGFLQTSRKTMY